MFGRTMLFITMLIALSGVTIMAFAISDVNTSKQIYQPLSNPIAGNTFNQVSSHSTSVSTTKKTKSTAPVLSISKVKLLAKKFIKQHGASPGTPKLVKYSARKVYVVPVIQNKIKVGEIDIDAITGKNLGGAGGAPN